MTFTQIICDRGNWNRIDSNLVEKLNKETEKQVISRKEAKKSISIKEPEKTNNSTSLKVSAKINLSDYINLGINGLYGNPVLISKFEIPNANNMNYENTHKFVLQQGLYVPTPSIFMTYFKNVVEASNKKIKLYDGNNQKIKKDELKDIYQHLTTNHKDVYNAGNSGVWTWLNARFVKGNGFLGFDLETINDLDKSGNLQVKKSPLESCEEADVYVNLDFNSQGLANTGCTSLTQEYQQGKNIYFYKPRENAVVGFFAGSNGAGLYCGRGPSGSDSSLGVFACAEGASEKNLGGLK